MTKHILNIVFVLLGLHNVQAQYSYFNQISGEIGDLSSEITSNIEVVNDGYVIWGALVDDGVLKHFVRKYNVDGEIVDENVLVFENEYVLTGVVNSFKWNPYNEHFAYIHGTNLNSGITEGYLIEFDSDLDTTFTRRFNQYSPYTYPFIFEVESDGYIVVGEQGGLPNSNGTFTMKLDFEGNVIWNEIMQSEINQHIYRNWGILPIDGGYMVTGNGKINGQFFGLITLLNDTGITQSEIDVLNNDEEQSGGFGGVQLMNGEYLLVQPLGYELVNENGNPNVFWNKTRLVKFNPYTETFYDTLDYFTNYEMILGGPSDLEATPDGGAIILGGRYGWFFDYYSWMMKVDADGNEEWFHEYTYENCDNCWNLLYDIELAPDGGYIAAGYFNNMDIDPRNNPWLLKVDACGELEWQGCAPVGVDEKEPQSFSVYPNPSGGLINIVTESQTQLEAYAIYDLSGRVVAQDRVSSRNQLTLELSLPVGFYALELVMDGGKRENHKIQIVR